MMVATTHQEKTQHLNLPQRENILRWPEVRIRVGLCRSQIHTLVQQGKFPKPIKLGARASGWIESEIDQWIENRISASRYPTPSQKQKGVA